MSAQPKRITGAPDEIWLVYGELEHDDTHANCYREGEVTWCEDGQFESDVRYVRADRMTALEAACEALRLKAARYDFLRDRLRLCKQQSMGGTWRDGIEFRVGRTFLDVPSRGASGYLDPAKYDAECDELDKQIDDAMGKETGNEL